MTQSRYVRRVERQNQNSETGAFLSLAFPALILAPMEGVTDAPMRALMTERGGFTGCVSEFLRISQNVPPARIYREHVPEMSDDWRTPSGVPIQLQLLGGDPERMAEAARVGIQAGARAIDLNFGCPAPTVNRHDGGATLLKHPDRIRAIVAAVRAAVPAELPVSAKVRLGWENINDIHLNADRAAEGGASWITIHARTRMQGYAPPVFWKPIGEVRARLPIPVVANGDIWTLEDFLRCRDMTQCKHFMLGRGALADPALPLAVAAELGLSLESPASFHSHGHGQTVAPSPEWVPLFRRFAELCHPFAAYPGFTLARLKQWLSLARKSRELPWTDELRRCGTLEAFFLELENGVAAVAS